MNLLIYEFLILTKYIFIRIMLLSYDLKIYYKIYYKIYIVYIIVLYILFILFYIL